MQTITVSVRVPDLVEIAKVLRAAGVELRPQNHRGAKTPTDVEQARHLLRLVSEDVEAGAAVIAAKVLAQVCNHCVMDYPEPLMAAAENLDQAVVTFREAVDGFRADERKQKREASGGENDTQDTPADDEGGPEAP